MEIDPNATFIIPMLSPVEDASMRLARDHRVNEGNMRDTDVKHHLYVKAELVMDGGMVEFIDPFTLATVGSCGIHFWKRYARRVTGFVPAVI